MAPVLKTQTRAKIVGLGIDGLTVADIQRRLRSRVSRSMIYEVLAEARVAGAAIPMRRTNGEIADSVRYYRVNIASEEVVTAVAEAARRRNISAQQLISELVAAAARDRLIDAVLDDA